MSPAPRSWPSLALALALWAQACSQVQESPAFACPAIAEPAVVVELFDSQTHESIEGATLLLSEGAYLEEMSGFEGRYQGGLERPGTYRVEIFAEGYDYAAVDEVVAPEGPCGPITQQLVVELDPVPAWIPVRLIVETENATLEISGAVHKDSGSSDATAE